MFYVPLKILRGLVVEARRRDGDLVCISLGANVVEYGAPGGHPRFSLQSSHHFGLTPEEMTVSLAVL
jgi:hypothetical protein